MRAERLLSGVAAVFMAGLTVLAYGAGPDESPDWWQVERDVAAALRQGGADIASLAATARSARPDTGWEAMFNLSVLLRAGMSRDAQAAVKQLRRTAPALESSQVASIYYVATDRLGAWDVAQTVVEEFAANVHEITLGNRLIKHMRESGWTADQIDQWLANMPPGRENFWVKERLRFNVEQGRGDDVVRQLSDQVRQNADDARQAIALLDALLYARPWNQGRPAPDLAWMTEAVKPQLATDAADLGERLREFKQPAPAVGFYRQAIETPLTEKEIERLARMSAVFFPAETVRAMFEAHVREGMAECLLALGRSAEAQRWMVESADIRKKHALGLNALFAGRVQAASGQRVIEGRIREKEKLSENDPAYWRERAGYYRGRNDAAQEEAALKKALALAKPLPPPAGGLRRQGDMRAWLVSDYASFLLRQERTDDAVALLRTEIAEAPADAESACAAARRLAFDFPQHVRADDENLWKWLANRPKWEHTEQRVLWRMLESADSAGRSRSPFPAAPANATGRELDRCFSRAEQLAKGHDPSRAAALGWIMNRMRHPQRSVSLLEEARRRASDQELRERAVFTLFESRLDMGDWERAEALFSEAAKRLTVHEQPDWHSRIAVLAAQAGARADALRIWKAGANMNPAEMRGLEELAKAGLRDELADYYRQMHERMPTSDVPSKALKTLERIR